MSFNCLLTYFVISSGTLKMIMKLEKKNYKAWSAIRLSRLIIGDFFSYFFSIFIVSNGKLATG